MSTALATPKQEGFLLKLARERQGSGTPELRVQIMQDIIDAGLAKQRASALISKLLQRPLDTTHAPAAVTAKEKQVDPTLTPGVYDVNGQVFVVKPNRAKTGLYAQRLVEIAGERLNVNNDLVNIEFVYAPGVIFDIKPEQKMPLEDAKVLTIRYGRCIVCGRHLKAGKSVEQGIGPVCIKSFA